MPLSTPDAVQTDIDIAPWVELIAARFGLQFGPTRVRRLEQGLRARIQKTGMPAAQYLQMIRRDSQAQEWQHLLQELVVGETRFFRHPPSFQLLESHIMPERIAANRALQSPECNILSAGCSNGSETYSLAMSALSLCRAAGMKLHVVGLDLSTQAIRFASEGRYPARTMRGLDSKRTATYFFSDDGGKTFEVREDMKACTTFQQKNLHMDSDLGGPYDVVFCQNLFIYLSKPDRQKMIHRFTDQLKPSGFLILGPAEVFKAQDERLQRLDFEQTLVFQRKPSPGIPSMREYS